MSEQQPLIICRCEDATDADLRRAIQTYDITDLNELKLITRAGKGVCQGRTCRPLMARLLAEATGQPVAGMSPWTARIPVRLIPCVALGRQGERDPSAEVSLTMMEVADSDRAAAEED